MLQGTKQWRLNVETMAAYEGTPRYANNSYRLFSFTFKISIYLDI